MGFLEWLGFGSGRVPEGLNAAGVPPFTSPFAGPTTGIQTVAFSDFYASELGESTRLGALQIPAVFRARSILTSVIASMPLRAYDAEGVEIDAPWLGRTATALPVWHRTAYTVDDLLFYGASLYAVERDGDTITDAYRVPVERWAVNGDGRILVDGKVAKDGDVIYIPGPGEGLLAVGGPTIKGARALDRAWIGRAQNPIPLVELHQVTDDELTDDEVEALVSNWAAARTSPNGAVGFTDKRVELRVHGDSGADLFEGARNASVLDLARLTAMPAALLDGSQSTATLTYSTAEGKANEFLTYSLGYWTAPIEARLSQDDVTPPGTYVRFDRSALVTLPQPTTDPAQDA